MKFNIPTSCITSDDVSLSEHSLVLSGCSGAWCAFRLQRPTARLLASWFYF